MAQNPISQDPKLGYGYIYILSNPSMPKVYKIGLTTNSVKKRINELNTTGIPKSFRAERIFQIQERHLKQVEKLAHKKLKNKDLHHGKEFFEGSLSDCVESVEDAIFEITNEHESDLIGEAKERAAADKRKRDNENERKTRLDWVNCQIDRQRSEYVENLRIQRRKNKPFLDKYFYEPLGYLVLCGCAILFLSILGELGPIGWIVGPIALYFFYKHCKDSDELKLIEAAKIKFPYKSLDNFEICEFQLKGSKNSEQKKLQTMVTATNISRDFSTAEKHKIGVINALGRKDDTQVTYLYHKAAEQGFADAQYGLGNMYCQGRGVIKDDGQAVHWYRKAAEQGFAKAQYNLGVMYYQGRGVSKDDGQAAYWYRQAAEQGVADAQYNLGIMYYQGKGVPKDDVQVVHWYHKAAEQGFVKAQSYLGRMYVQGRGVSKDEVQAEYWYRKAAEQGNADAQFSLGVMNALGRKDDTQAAYWYRQAAEQGVADAQYNLGIMYYQGRGVIKDDGQAAYWYRQAAEQGHVLAQAKLGVSYSQGRGITKDEKKAYFWYLLSSAQGNENVINARDSIEKQLTPQQRANVQAEASAWKPKKN